MRVEKSRTLLFAVGFPNDGIDPEDVDPEDVADLLVDIINEERRRNWPEKGRANDVTVSAIPAAQWMTRRTIEALRAPVTAVAERDDEVERLREALRRVVAGVMHICPEMVGCPLCGEARVALDAARALLATDAGEAR